jgi:O-antigen/teichoic acid export membrane protein
MNLVIKDAAWQIAWRLASAIGWFLVITLITPYLWPLRFGDYSTILKYFAIWSAFADFGVYVIALKELGVLKSSSEDTSTKSVWQDKDILTARFSKFVSLRICMIVGVYTLALVIAYLIPAYSSNPYLIWGLPLWLLFSASFMGSWILQIPLQLFWKMEQVSIALILARVSQLWVIGATVYWLYTNPWFESGQGQSAFLMIIASVVVSGMVQLLYTRWQWSKYLSFQFNLDWEFFKRIIGWNWKYGFAYYLSSFHTLLVLMVFSWLYPTTQWFTYVWVWALALSLIEIMLIVPSALGNSLIHDVSGNDRNSQKKRYSALLRLVTWIGGVVMIMCALFAPHVIQLMGWSDYLTSATSIGSDTILPFLSFVLLLSFIRQVHNYLFVSTWHQNTLFGINLFGVTVWLIIWLPLIITYGLWWGIITQILLEVLFLGGSLRVAHRQKISLVFPRKIALWWVTTACISWIWVSEYLLQYSTSLTIRIPIALGCVSILVWGSRNWLKRTMRQL